ncbi:hypothetical protein BD410DRAFT_460067 [Rickenella mellea]|uniref:Uncharacterized protein n=1 Tax=Rickenella mellea TaxID=50990 RepID=A0A4Y7PW38_9AGAM|nr:hypothetical protein BD410DRAFT_460067 [Rickenella mellea]
MGAYKWLMGCEEDVLSDWWDIDEGYIRGDDKKLSPHGRPPSRRSLRYPPYWHRAPPPFSGSRFPPPTSDVRESQFRHERDGNSDAGTTFINPSYRSIVPPLRAHVCGRIASVPVNLCSGIALGMSFRLLPRIRELRTTTMPIVMWTEVCGLKLWRMR